METDPESRRREFKSVIIRRVDTIKFFYIRSRIKVNKSALSTLPRQERVGARAILEIFAYPNRTAIVVLTDAAVGIDHPQRAPARQFHSG
jgi:hypothetical protein